MRSALVACVVTAVLAAGAASADGPTSAGTIDAGPAWVDRIVADTPRGFGYREGREVRRPHVIWARYTRGNRIDQIRILFDRESACDMCSGPMNAVAPRGTMLTIGFRAGTHTSVGFSFGSGSAAKLARASSR